MKNAIFVVVFVLIISISNTDAHPAYQHHFNNIVNANPCLKQCMDEATKSDNELNILKTANVTNYLLNSDEICNVISTAKACIDACNVNSNPFDLESMKAVCQPASKIEIRLLTPCLEEHGFPVMEECETSCGDYDLINDEVFELSKFYRPEVDEAEKVAEVLHKINEGCMVLKCSNRCTSKLLNERCNTTADGRDSSKIFRSVIERVLIAQRHDLERMKLSDTMAQSVPVQCNYMYVPEVMFNVTKDEQALEAIGEALRKEHHNKLLQNAKVAAKKSDDTLSGDSMEKLLSKDNIAGSITNEETTNNASKKELNLALSQIQAQLLHKQMEMLELQELNIKKESRKLDLELKLALRKGLLLKAMEASPQANDVSAQSPL